MDKMPDYMNESIETTKHACFEWLDDYSIEHGQNAAWWRWGRVLMELVSCSRTIHFQSEDIAYWQKENAYLRAKLSDAERELDHFRDAAKKPARPREVGEGPGPAEEPGNIRSLRGNAGKPDGDGGTVA